MIKKNLLTITILEGIEESEGCPLCYLWLKSEKRHMEYLLYKTAYGGRAEDGLGYTLYMQGPSKQSVKSSNSYMIAYVALKTRKIAVSFPAEESKNERFHCYPTQSSTPSKDNNHVQLANI